MEDKKNHEFLDEIDAVVDEAEKTPLEDETVDIVNSDTESEETAAGAAAAAEQCVEDMIKTVEIDESEPDTGTLESLEVNSLIEDVIHDIETAEKKKKGKTFMIVVDLVRRAVMLVAIGVYMYSVYSLTNIYLDYKQGGDVYEKVNALFEVNLNEQTDASGTLTDVDDKNVIWNFDKEDTVKWVWDYDKLLALNEDAVGWIAIEDTNIHYPIVQGTDNDYYLHHTVDKAYNFSGTVFVDYRYPDGLDSHYSIIYGHYLKNGTMFAYLNPYQYADYGRENNVFDIYIEDKHYHYYLFSVYVTKGVETADSPYQFDVNPSYDGLTEEQKQIYLMSEEERADYRDGLSAADQKIFDANLQIVKKHEEENPWQENLQSLIDRIESQSKYSIPVNEYTENITPEDNILTISTCWVVSENTRLILHLVRGEEVIDNPDAQAADSEKESETTAKQ